MKIFLNLLRSSLFAYFKNEFENKKREMERKRERKKEEVKVRL